MLPFCPARLDATDYVGRHRYSLTLCTADAIRAFCHPPIVSRTLSQLRTHAAAQHFAVSAYCFLPARICLVIVGTKDDADLKKMIFQFRQAAALGYWQATGFILWQSGYFVQVLHDEQEALAMCRTVITAPIRAGLTRMVGQYPFAGSDVYRLADLEDRSDQHACWY
jgi:hypothetical protein